MPAPTAVLQMGGSPPCPHWLRTAALVNLAAVLERCDEQVCRAFSIHHRAICPFARCLEHSAPAASCMHQQLRSHIIPTACFHASLPFPMRQMLPAVYRFIGASWGATPTQLGTLTLCRALVQALSSPLGGIAGEHARRLSIAQRRYGC